MSDEARVQDLAERTYALIAAEDMEGARALYAELEQLAPTSRDALLVKAALLSNEDPDGAMAVVDEVYARWPHDPSVLMARASYLLELYAAPEEALPLVEEAVSTLEEVVGESSDGQAFLVDARVMLADCRLSVGDAEGAREAAQAAVRADPGLGMARLALAAAHFALCDLEEAIAEAKRALDADRSLADAHHLIGRSAQARREMDIAERAFEDAHALAPDRFPLPYRVGTSRFLELLHEARNKLPAAVKEALTDVELRVEARPDLEVLREQEQPVPPDVPCLVEVSLLEEGEDEEPSYVLDGLVVFQENMELLAGDEDELLTAIIESLTAEVAGTLGLEDELEGPSDEGPASA